jgi:hypothetical protein
LKEEFSQGLILPVGKEGVMPTTNSSSNIKNGTAQSSTTTCTTTSSSSTTNQPSNVSSKNIINDAVKIQTKKITMTEEFKCRAHGNFQKNYIYLFNQNIYILTNQELYQVFTDINVSISINFI